ncbi:MAG: hypothetical protein KF752_18645 [Pirellulaceae bacterium]|nr:hypothetical protein [Pirellulaceae bacterium]
MRVRLNLTLAAIVLGSLVGCASTARHNLPSAQQLLEPGPGVGGPGPGVMGAEIAAMAGGQLAAYGGMGGDVIPASHACSSGCCGSGDGVASGGMMAGMMPGSANIQVLFSNPDGMQIHFDSIGDGSFGSQPLYVPGRLEFPQGGIFRLKLTNIVGLEGVELYPTLEVAAGNIRTAAYLAHNAIPVQFTQDDFQFVIGGNFVTKVIYLPDPEYQGDALAGVGVMSSNRLEPGLDPIVEADRRGAILAIVRIGNKDIEMSNQNGGLPMMTAAMIAGAGGPNGCLMMGGVPTSLPGYVAGVTGPQYGMTYSGTPIGLPGPPHIPLGTPAGLQKHTIRNTTHTHIPDPVSHVQVNVRQTPGVSYPNPPSHVKIREQNIHPGVPTGMPLYMRHSQNVGPDMGAQSGMGGGAGAY